MKPIINFTFRSTNIIKCPQVTIIKRTMLTSVKKGATSMDLAKETFVIFCNHFSKIPYHDLHKDDKVIQFFIESIHKKNSYCNKAFQLALDVTYSKRVFDRKNILSNFSEMSFRNSIDSSDHTSMLDQSTLFIALQSKIVKEMYPNWEVLVNQTPPSNISLNDFSPQEVTNLEQNKTLTGNRFPDVVFNGIPYDFKSTKEISNTKNHVYIMSESEKAFKDFFCHIDNLYTRIQTDSKIPVQFRTSVSKKLNDVKHEFLTATSPTAKHEIIANWNNFSIEMADQRPPHLGTAIFVVTNKPYVVDQVLYKETQNVILAEGHLDQVKTKEALRSIIDNYPESLKDSIYQATRGAISHVLPKDTVE